MKLVIDIDNETYKQAINRTEFDTLSLGLEVIEAVQNGTPLPNHHGRLIDADRVEDITWEVPSYTDALNVLTEVRDRVRVLPTIIEGSESE